mgnify:CR=1 FL=1
MDDYSYPLHQSGFVSTLPIEESNRIIEALRESIYEITGKRVEQPEQPKMGFY